MSTPDHLDPAAIDLMLDESTTWAVVGLSGDPHRTAFEIARLLQARGKRIVPVHPRFADSTGADGTGADSTGDDSTGDDGTVLGEKGYATLADIPFAVDVVDVFRRSADAGPFADQAVAIGAKGVWFQLGVVDHAAFERTRAAGVAMVMDTCPAIELRRRGA